MTTACLVLAHGSADPRHASGVRALADAVGRELGQSVAVAYLDHHGPTPAEAARALTDRGSREVLVLPLFTAAAYHVKVDVPAAVASMRATGSGARLVTPGIASTQELLSAVVDAAGILQDGAGAGAVVLGTGSSDAAANALLAAQVGQLSARSGVPLATAFLGGGRALAQVRAEIAGVPAVLPFVVSNGMFFDRMKASAAALGLPVRGGPLTENPLVASLAARRFRSEIRASQDKRERPLTASL